MPNQTPPSPELPPLARLRQIVHLLRAPGGCPWDREQTHQSLVPNLIEEAYEVADALRRGDDAHLREELGDLLLQVVMHAEIGAERDAFDLDSVAGEVAEKLVRRHPHVFAESDAADTGAVLAQWDDIKRAEKGQDAGPALGGVARGLPALLRATKLQKRAARVGFDWPDAADVLAKVREETAEVEAVLGDPPRLEEELGDLLFAVVNLARKAGLDAESTLAAANQKFVRRFHAMEQRLAADGTPLAGASLEDMEAAWQAVKGPPHPHPPR